MSSFRRPKSEAALRLYSLPRRELQSMCKQYGIPANKTNVAMADALAACVPADYAKPKASAGSALGVAKTIDMKLKVEKKVGLPETSLASFILTGKRKSSPTKVTEVRAEVEDGGFPKLNTTPLKRGVKKSVQAVQEEKPKITAVPAFTRAIQDRIKKVSSAAAAVSSPKPPVPTPRKRAAESATVVTRRGGDALPPVSFLDLVSTPEKRHVHEIIDLNSTAKTSNKRRTRLALKIELQEQESHAAVAENKVSKGKRVVFADEVEPPKAASLEPETETIEVSYAEIEFKDAAIHKELFGFGRGTPTDQEQDVKEDLENREDAEETEVEFRDRALHQELFGAHMKEASDPCEELVEPTLDLQQAGTLSSVVEVAETEFEFRDRALHQELFGAHMKEESDPCEEVGGSTLDLQQAGSSASAVELERRSFDTATSYPAECLIDSDNVPVQEHSVISSIREDVCEGSDRQGEALEELTEQNLAHGADPRPLPSDDLVENICEVPDHSHASSLECSPAEVQSDCCTLQQEPSSADAYVAIDDVRGSEVAEHQLEKQETVMLVDGNVQQHQTENLEVVLVVDGDIEEHQSENNDVVMLVGGDTEQKQAENHEVVMPLCDDIQEHQSEHHEVVMPVGDDIQEHQSENLEIVMPVCDDVQEHQTENLEVVMPVGDDIQEHQSKNSDVVMLVGGDTEQKQVENLDVVMPVCDDIQEHQSEHHEVVMPVCDDIQEHQSENSDVVMLVGGDTEQKKVENHDVFMPVGDDIQEHQLENNDVVMLVGGDNERKRPEKHEVVMPVCDDIQEHQSENLEDVMVVDADIKHHQSENHDIVDGLVDELVTEQCPEESFFTAQCRGESFFTAQCAEESFFSSDPGPDEAQKAQAIISLESDEVQRSSQLDENEKVETSRKSLVAVGSELVMASPSSHSIPATPVMNAQDNSTKRLSGPASSNASATPVTVAQVHSAKRLSGPGTFNVPVTPVSKVQENSFKRMRIANVPVTPVASAQDNGAKRKWSSPTVAHHDSAKLFSVPSSASIPVTPVTKFRDSSHSALAEAATPLSKLQSDINSTLAKATSILEKLSALRADAERKLREGSWEPKFSTGVESSSPPDVERPLAKPVLAVDRNVISAKKARPAPKSVLGLEKPLIVCEDTLIVSKGDMPSAKKMRTSDERKDSLEVSDKENQSDKSTESDKSFRKMGGLGKDKKKGKRFEVLKDRSKNVPDHGTGLAPIKESTGRIRPGDMSLRKLRAQVKQKVSQLETSKASPLKPQKAWNTSH